ncbi:MAG: DUF2158 domain-containing protein [Acidiferrobacteraceae bacterium]
MPLTIGDVVVLKSGSPKMTVVGEATEKDKNVYCAYFRGDQPATAAFPAAALAVVDRQSSGTVESRRKARQMCDMLRERGHTAETNTLLRAQEAGDFDEPDGSVVWKPEVPR